MDLGLTGKVAWVLGASSGLGLACARSLSDEGARVAVSARSPGPLGVAAEEVGALAVPVDVSDSRSVERGADAVVSQLGPVQILIANAGGPRPGTFESLQDRDLSQAVELTLAAAWRLTKAVLPGMREAGGGCIVFITSWSTKEVIPGLLLSNSVRAAVVGLAKSLSKELGPDSIRVLCVAPGRIDTPRAAALDASVAAARGIDIEQVRRDSSASVPLGRYGEPREVGDVVAFLASERSSYLNGITVTVDGGMLNRVDS